MPTQRHHDDPLSPRTLAIACLEVMLDDLRETPDEPAPVIETCQETQRELGKVMGWIKEPNPA